MNLQENPKLNRVGQWKLLSEGPRRCIAQGDGYVMIRSRALFPYCLESKLWDEAYDYLPSAPEWIWNLEDM